MAAVTADRGTYRYSGVVTALGPIHQGGEGSDGTIKPFGTQKMLQSDGETTVAIPYITGNSIRGQLRDIAADHCLQALGYGEQSTAPNLFYFLFSGGALSKGTSGAPALDVGAVRQLTALLPIVSLLGGGVGTHLLHGKLRVGHAIPLCQETAHQVPERYRDRCRASIWDLRDILQFSRQDDSRSRYGERYLAPTDLAALEAPRRLAETAPAVPAQPLAAERGTAVQMRYGYETLAAGTQFYWSLSVVDASPLELSALYTILLQWAAQPHFGGKAATGFGEVALSLDSWMAVDPRRYVEPALVVGSDGIGPDRYHAHIDAHQGEMRELIDRLAATLA